MRLIRLLDPAIGHTFLGNQNFVQRNYQSESLCNLNRSHCGEVTHVTKNRSGSLNVHGDDNLWICSHFKGFVNIKVVVSVHKTLNSWKGIVHDRACCLSGMTEDGISKALDQQSIRQTIHRKGCCSRTDTYLFTFVMNDYPSIYQIWLL